MNYSKIYDSLITKGRNRILLEYGEKHHIVPRCLNGSDDKSNLVILTPEEHYIAHQLLIRIHPNNFALVKAAAMMIVGRPNNKLYGWLRKRFAIAQSISQTGSGNSQFGTRWIHNPLTLEEKKIKDDCKPNDWVYGRYKQEKIKPPTLSQIKREQQIKIHKEYYELYKQVGFTEFVKLTGYDKSKANLVQRFAVLLDNFVPQNGKKR